MIRLNAKLILIGLFFVDLFFVVAHLVVVNLGFLPSTLTRGFDLVAEQNLPAWFSGSQFLFLALLAMVRSAQLRDRSRHRFRRFYLLMAAVFLFFSLDEIASVHENLTRLSLLPGYMKSWVFLYSASLLVILLLFKGGLVDFLRETPGRTAYLTGAAVLVLGGVILEVPFLLYSEYLLYTGSEETFLRPLNVVLKEGCELLGQSIMIYALSVKVGSFSVSFSASDEIAGHSSSRPMRTRG